MIGIGDKLLDLPVEARPLIRYTGAGVFQPSVKTYCLKEHWTLHLFHYCARFEVDDGVYELAPGILSLWPPGVTKTYHFLEPDSAHYCAHFCYEGTGQTVRVPPVIDLEKSFSRVDDQFAEIVQLHSENRFRAEVKLWDLLLGLQDAVASQADCMHPSLRKAVRMIELQLAEKIEVPVLAREAGLSQNHLLRLFKAQFGITIQAYILKRRMERARHLLQYSDRMVKQVAYEVGIHDLQYFNKLVRREFGCSPRALRG